MLFCHYPLGISGKYPHILFAQSSVFSVLNYCPTGPWLSGWQRCFPCSFLLASLAASDWEACRAEGLGCCRSCLSAGSCAGHPPNAAATQMNTGLLTQIFKKAYLSSKCDWAATSLPCLHAKAADCEAERLWCLYTKAKLSQLYSLLPKTKPGTVWTNPGIKAAALGSEALLWLPAVIWRRHIYHTEVLALHSS